MEKLAQQYCSHAELESPDLHLDVLQNQTAHCEEQGRFIAYEDEEKNLAIRNKNTRLIAYNTQEYFESSLAEVFFDAVLSTALSEDVDSFFFGYGAT